MPPATRAVTLAEDDLDPLGRPPLGQAVGVDHRGPGGDHGVVDLQVEPPAGRDVDQVAPGPQQAILQADPALAADLAGSSG